MEFHQEWLHSFGVRSVWAVIPRCEMQQDWAQGSTGMSWAPPAALLHFPAHLKATPLPGKSLPTHPLWSWSFPGWGRWRAWGTPCGWGWGGPCRRHHRQSGCSGSLWHPWHSPQHTLGKEVKMGRDQRKQQPKFTPGLRGEGKNHPASFHRIEDHGDNFN